MYKITEYSNYCNHIVNDAVHKTGIKTDRQTDRQTIKPESQEITASTYCYKIIIKVGRIHNWEKMVSLTDNIGTTEYP